MLEFDHTIAVVQGLSAQRQLPRITITSGNPVSFATGDKLQTRCRSVVNVAVERGVRLNRPAKALSAQGKPTAPSPRADDLLSGKGATHCYNGRGEPAGSKGDATGVLFQVIRPRQGYHLRVAEKPGDEPNRITADQAGSFRLGRCAANFYPISGW